MNDKQLDSIIQSAKSTEEAKYCITLMNLLEPCLKRNSKLRYPTPFGDKSEIGLYRTLKRFFEEAE